MPHVAIKLFPGRTEDQKQRLAEEITKDMMSIFGSKEESISVSFEEVQQPDWKDQVYLPEIRGKWDKVYKKPGYEL